MSGMFLVLSVALQIALVALLFARRLARSLAFFTAMILFYVVRSVLLFAAFRHISREAYAVLYSGLSLFDVVLQVGLAIEIGVAILRTHGKPWLPRAMAVPGLVVVAAALTAAVAAALPVRSPMPADRAAIFTGLLFAGMFAWSLTVRLRRWERVATAGLALVGMTAVLSQAAKSLAASQRNAHAYMAWSYLDASVYLAVLMVWVGACWTSSSSAGVAGRALARPGEYAPVQP